jgi:hypothetical protein
MSESYRHHRATPGGPETRIIFVPVPVAGPDYGKSAKPPPYPTQRWPKRMSRGEATAELMRRLARQDEAARQIMQRAREISHAQREATSGQG